MFLTHVYPGVFSITTCGRLYDICKEYWETRKQIYHLGSLNNLGNNNSHLESDSKNWQ